MNKMDASDDVPVTTEKKMALMPANDLSLSTGLKMRNTRMDLKLYTNPREKCHVQEEEKRGDKVDLIEHIIAPEIDDPERNRARQDVKHKYGSKHEISNS